MAESLIKFQIHENDTGKLISLENKKEFPFEIKRVYYIYDVFEGCRRGFHAHKNLKQLLFCVSGSCRIFLDDGKGATKDYLLDKPDFGLLIDSTIWREMYDFKKGTVLVVLASDYYSESDYIRDYETFKRYVLTNKI